MNRFTSLVALAVLSLAACKLHTDDDSGSAEAAVDSTEVATAESSLLAANLDGAETAPAALTDAGPTPQGVADFIAQRAPQRYQPAGCVTVAETGLVVKLTFAQCTGPRGLRELNGELDLTVSAGAAGAIDVAAHAAGLEVGQATLDVDSSAIHTVDNGTRTLAVSTHGTGTGGLGNAITHDGDYTASWDASCVSLDGMWSTEVGEKSRSTTASVKRCLGACPTGTITRDTFLGRTITITFDGTSTATWTTSAGRSGSFRLACGT